MGDLFSPFVRYMNGAVCFPLKKRDAASTIARDGSIRNILVLCFGTSSEAAFILLPRALAVTFFETNENHPSTIMRFIEQ